PQALPTLTASAAATRWPSDSRLRIVAQVGEAYTCILVALWTVSHALQAVWIFAAAVSIAIFTYRSRYSRYDLGLRWPSRAGVSGILLFACSFVAGIFVIASLVGQRVPATPRWPSTIAIVEYAVWAMLQQFMLQSFFFVNLEARFGSKRAGFAVAILFSLAHLPNPVLTIATFF